MVSYIDVGLDDEGQRIDNFLIRTCKGVPKTRLYRAIRGGEVRVNKKRVKPSYKVQSGDVVRLPPLKVAQRPSVGEPEPWMVERLQQAISYEDNGMILLDKPSGMAVHGGQSESLGVIEALRLVRSDCTFLELAHRLDRGTSGCLIIAKRRSYLRAMHQKLRDRKVKKTYLALVKGRWQGGTRKMTAPLCKKTLPNGERVVKIDRESGKSAVSYFSPIQKYRDATLMLVKIKTGRTHQIRVHAASMGFPLAGDDKYGCPKFNQNLKHLGLSRLFLHAACVDCTDDVTGYGVYLGVVLPKVLKCVLNNLN